MSTPGTANAQTIRYKKVVCFGLANQAINFASAASLGHRVLVSMPVDLMNKYFYWTRTTGTPSPIGRFKNVLPPVGNVPQPTFVDTLVAAFSGDYTDLDGVATGLNFSSSALDMANNLKRDPDVGTAIGNHNSANDLVMAYLMFKCFGSSAYDPTDIIYNLADAFGMLTSEQLANAIEMSLAFEDGKAATASAANPHVATADKGSVDAMFRAFLAADPMRYFLGGKQIPGLFESNYTSDPADVPGPADSNWCLTVGDKIEIPLQLVFTESVKVLSVQDNIKNPSSSTPDEVYTTCIEGDTTYATGGGTALAPAQPSQTKGNTIAIRLMLVCSTPTAGNTGSTSGSNPPLQKAAQASAIFYTAANYGPQSAIVVMAAGGSGSYGYTYSPAVAGVEMNTTSGVLTFTPSGQAASRTAVTVTVTDGTAAPLVVENIYITLNAASGTSTNSGSGSGGSAPVDADSAPGAWEGLSPATSAEIAASVVYVPGTQYALNTIVSVDFGGGVIKYSKAVAPSSGGGGGGAPPNNRSAGTGWSQVMNPNMIADIEAGNISYIAYDPLGTNTYAVGSIVGVSVISGMNASLEYYTAV